MPNVLIMGYSNRSLIGNKTTFSQLDVCVKKQIADTIAMELLLHLNRRISVELLMDIMDKFDVDVDVCPDETFTLYKNAKLEIAVKNISAKF